MEKLNLMAPINTLGYGVVGTNLLKYLSKQMDIALFPIGNVDITLEHVLPPNPTDKMGNRICHRVHMAGRAGHGLCKHIAMRVVDAR